MSYFVKIILVQLSHKASKVAMLEVLGQDGLRKLLILFGKLSVVSMRLLGPLRLRN